MDPDEVLLVVRAASDVILTEQHDPLVVIQAAHLVAEGVQALDTWLTKGGFLPSDWTLER